MSQAPTVFVLARWQAVGNLNNGANDGLACANSNNRLGSANWNIAGREFGEIKVLFAAYSSGYPEN
jgi:hypothetical protein